MSRGGGSQIRRCRVGDVVEFDVELVPVEIPRFVPCPIDRIYLAVPDDIGARDASSVTDVVAKHRHRIVLPIGEIEL